jgi:hypothetical protein
MRVISELARGRTLIETSKRMASVPKPRTCGDLYQTL